MRKKLSPTQNRYRKKKIPLQKEVKKPEVSLSIKSIILLMILTAIVLFVAYKFYKNIEELRIIDIKLNSTRYQILKDEKIRIEVNKEVNDLETEVQRQEQKIKQLKQEEELLITENKNELERVNRLNKTIENYILVDKEQNKSLIDEQNKMNDYKLAIENLNSRISDVKATKKD